MAAVKLAQRAGAEVFATAGSKWKRELLREMGVTHVFDSRSASFAGEILAHTNGRGVDLVLNSLSGELIDAGFRALTRGGTFVEIGKRGIKDPEWVAGLHRDLHYFTVDESHTEKSVGLMAGLLARLVEELRNGTLTALPRQVFESEEVGRAFRFMAQIAARRQDHCETRRATKVCRVSARRNVSGHRRTVGSGARGRALARAKRGSTSCANWQTWCHA